MPLLLRFVGGAVGPVAAPRRASSASSEPRVVSVAPLSCNGLAAVLRLLAAGLGGGAGSMKPVKRPTRAPPPFWQQAAAQPGPPCAAAACSAEAPG